MTESERPRHLALDFGGRRIGVAVSDPIGDGVAPLTVIERRNDQQAADEIVRLIDEYHIRVCVAGLPLHMDGDAGEQVQKTRSFIGRVRKARPDVRYEYWDERLSSFEADEWMRARGIKSARQKALRDQLAAAVILEEYLSAHPRTDG